MDGWIKWLGELVWRMSRLPARVRGDEREENFYYRLYGVLCLFLSLVALSYIAYKTAEPLSKLVAELVRYAGPDKFLAQGYAGAVVAIIVFLVITVTAFLLSALISIPAGIGLLVVRVISWKSYLWAKLFKTKQAAKELTPEQREGLLFMFLGLLAGFILWVALKAATTPSENAKPEEPTEPPVEKNNDAQPAA